MKKLLLTLLPCFFISCLWAQMTPHWDTVSSGTAKDLYSISFANPKIGFIGGEGGLLLKTADSGQTWQVWNSNIGIGSNQLVSDVVDLQFLDTLHGYAVLSKYPSQQFQGILIQTSDGGQTWTPANDSVNIAASRCYFFSWGNGFLLGSAFFAGNTLEKMQNGTWTIEQNLFTSPAYFNYGIDFRDTLTGIIGGDGGNFYRTFDGGQTWDTVYSGKDSTIYAIKYLNDSTIIAATGHGNRSVIISHDNGATWTDEVNSFTFAYPIMKSIAVAAGDSVITVGHTTNWGMPNEGAIYWFNGQSWLEQDFQRALYDVAKQSVHAAYAVGDSGLIATNKEMPKTSVSEVEKLENNMSIYPNPSQATIHLNYSDIKIQSLELFDLSGRLIKSFTPKSKTLDIAKIAAGVYFLKIKANSVAISKKVIITNR